ncbi:putative spermidine/putrescine ABC transporter ATPase subunit [Alteracholeplasma palmae J233]|uniref:Putative spermidine/putrescine ABC transporter ATPase subunit n=1 Tax=Alteracholeplasma palmae (strain ATCC 49389 / J233) TaxID=1318466 RepID=U4KS26_ALTPJ|nr:ABC transporter ATP-binding protein [Alteracholeplasma palmae]CCV64661.1 putative spermidine/putrescine ABC transporter ATPase subunit [Alteracholeplasma palmae J233]
MGDKVIIELLNVTKQFDDEVIVNSLNLQVFENEFLTLLGPSGCGKTTTLRMIGGFEKANQGEIIIEGKDFSDLPPYARPINTVFQKYALFPHLNVIDNVAFGLKNRSWEYLINFYHLENENKKEVKKKINELIKASALEALSLVNLKGYENRRITQMSGGQQQRVALARAIVNKPKILLLDEPLAALDLKLRQKMQYELKEMQRQLGITFIFVTHDQEEAMTMSDRIAVMDKGIIVQLGTPKAIYNEPVNRYVATFIGESNIIPAVYLKKDLVSFMGVDFECMGYTFKKNEKVDVVIRPEDFDVVDLDKAKLIGKVTSSLFKGVHNELLVDIKGTSLKVNTYENYVVGEDIGLKVDPYEIHIMKVNEYE